MSSGEASAMEIFEKFDFTLFSLLLYAGIFVTVFKLVQSDLESEAAEFVQEDVLASYVLERPLTSSDLTVRISWSVLAAP